MALKVKEIKDDAIISVEVNKMYYMMVKNTMFYLFSLRSDEAEKIKSLEKLKTNKLEEFDEWEKAFHTLLLLNTEIEKVALANNQYEEKEILEPGDEGYTAPTQG